MNKTCRCITNKLMHILKYSRLSGIAAITALLYSTTAGAISFTTLQTLKVDPAGGMGTVEACEFSPNGTLIAAGNAQGECRIYETATGKLIRTLVHIADPAGTGKAGEVESIYWSHDGTMISTTGNKTGIKIWKSTGELVKTLSTSATSDGAAWSPDGKWHANQTGIYDVATWTRLKTLGHSCDVNSIDFTSDSKYMVSAGCDHKAKIWRVSDWSVLRTIDAGSSIKSVRISPDVKYIATGCSSPSVYGVIIWNFDDGKQVAYLPNPLIEGTGTGSEAVAWTPDGAHVLNGASRNGIEVYSRSTWKKTYRAPGLARCEYIDIYKDLCIGGGEEGVVVLWKMSGIGAVSSRLPVPISVKSMADVSGPNMIYDLRGCRIGSQWFAPAGRIRLCNERAAAAAPGYLISRFDTDNK